LVEVPGAAHVLFEEEDEVVDRFMQRVLDWIINKV
jgi:alpha-beta hydrolase superfamily lysophospholipase